MNTNEFYNKKGLEARKLRKDEVDEFAINLRLKWKDQEFTRIADRIWRNNNLRALLNFTPQVGKLEDDDRVLPVKEINKWCKRSIQLFSSKDIQEQYFSIFQRDPEHTIENWSPYRTYLPGELVQYVPEINQDVWRLEDEFEMRGGKIYEKATDEVVSPQDAKWKLFSEVKGKDKPVEIQPPVLVSYEAFQPEILDLSTMSRCYWMCLKHIVGEDRVPVKRNLNESDANFRIRAMAQERVDREAVINKKLEPRLDYLHMDQDWIPPDRKKGIQDLLKGRGWPGSEYWVCLHFPGTGQMMTESKPGNAMPVQELRVSHEQVWYARAAFLSRIVKIHSIVPKLLNKYNKGQYLQSEEENLRRRVLSAYTAIDRYSNDLNNLGTVTIDRAMDVVASDMVNNSHKEKYQIFYRKDFQNVIERVDGVARTTDEDVWGKLKYIAAGARMRYGHGAVKAMEAVFANQGLTDHETYIRRVIPKKDQDDFQDPVESVERHWDERAVLWEKLYDYFHQPLIEWEKMHYQFEHSSNVELNKRLGIEKAKFHELVKNIMIVNKGMPFPQIPTEGGWFSQLAGKSKAMEIVDEAREFFEKGLKFFKMAYEEEKEYLRINPIGPGSSSEDKKMVYSMLRYRPAGKYGDTIRYILQCLYNGASNTESGALHDISSDGSQFFDWGSRIRKLFFKFCMYYGLLRHRAIIEENEDFEFIYNNWSTIRIRTFKEQNISLKAYSRIWEQGEAALINAKDNAIWQINIFQTDGPRDGQWEAFAAHPLKEYGKNNQTIEIRPNIFEETPLLFKTKKSKYWQGKYGPDGESVRWKKMLDWWFIYMRKLDMAAVDNTWSEGTSVYQACNELKKKHIRFLVAYLPEYRVYSDKLYGPLVFGRLQTASETVYDGAVLHVVAYCERLKLEDETLEKINEDLTCMQWTVNGFEEEDNVTVWLSGTKNILTQTVTKNPINLYGPSALTPEQEAALKDIYDSTGDHVRKDLEKSIKDYNELRTAQEKQEAALIEITKEEEEQEDELKKLQKQRETLEEQLRGTVGLINDIKTKAVANPIDNQ